MEAIDYRYEATLDYFANRKKYEVLAEAQEDEVKIIGECEECGTEIFNDSCEHFYSEKLGIFLCDDCVSSRWGKLPKGTVR